MRSVAFTSETVWTRNEGLIHLDGDLLLIEYQRTLGGIGWLCVNIPLFFLPLVFRLDELFKSRVRTVRVPLAAVTSLTLQEAIDASPARMVLVADRMAVVQDLPGMRQGRVDMVVVGADRIAANGDTANKIGTYAVAVLAREHGIPFYVAAPLSTVDLSTPDGWHIPIEERSSREVTHVGAAQLAPAGAQVWNPAFDVTPHHLIAGIITEQGILREPYTESLKRARE